MPALLVALSSVPYLLAWRATPAGTTYDWLLPPYPEDGLAYLAWVRQAARGALLFKLKYTAIPHAAHIFQPFFLLAGWLCRILRIEPGLALFGLRIAGVILFAVALQRWLSRWGLGARARAAALLFVAISSGVGAFVPATLHSADLSFVDLNTLWSITWNPLFPYALALLIQIVDRAARDDSTPRAHLLLGALLALLAFLHPYDVMLALPLGLAILLASRGIAGIRSLAWMAIPLAPALAWQLWLSLNDPLLAQHGARGQMLTQPMEALLLGLGIPALLAMAGAYFVLRAPKPRLALPLLLWIGLSLVLCHLPVWFQRKLLFGIHIPICVLAGIGVDGLLTQLEIATRPALARVFAAISLFISVPIISATQLLNARTLAQELRERDPAAYYLPSALCGALAFLLEHGDVDEVVLAAPATSRLIPGASGNTVLYGHWAQSVDAQTRMQWLAFILDPNSPMTDSQRLAEFSRANIRYVLLDPPGRAFFGPLPAWLTQASRTVFKDGDVELLRISLPAAAGGT